MTSVIPEHASVVAGREPGAQGDGNDRRILGAVRHLDGDDVGAIVHRTIVEDVLDEARPRILGLGRCRRRNMRAEHNGADDAERAGDAEEAETTSGHGGSPSLGGVNIRHWSGYSHSISEYADVALRAL